jgi:hypothetical protein
MKTKLLWIEREEENSSLDCSFEICIKLWNNSASEYVRTLWKKDNHTKEMHKWHDDFISWFSQCLVHVVVTSFGLGLHSIPLKWSKDQTWVPQFSSFSQVFPSWGISTSWSLSPLQNWSQVNHKSKGGNRNTHKNYSHSNNTHKSRNEHTKQRSEVTAQRSAQISITMKRMRACEV